MINKIFSILLLLLVSCPVLSKEQAQSKNQKRYNILILSVCSLNKHHLPFYGYKRQTAPNLTLVSKKSFIFQNAYSPLPWTNPAQHVNRIDRKVFAENNYEMISEMGPQHLHHYILREADLNALAQTFLSKIKKDKPFISQIHFKTVHYPYLDHLRPEEYPSNHPDYIYRTIPYKFITPEELKFFEGRINSKNLSLQDLPFLNIVIKDFATYFKKSTSKKISTEIIWPYNQELIQKWKTSSNFQKDFNFLINSYDGRISLFDHKILPFLSLFNKTELKENTVLIFTGDHGESLMDHDRLHAAETTYDDQLKIPLLIHFPNMTKSVSITRQVSEASLGKIVEAIAQGKLSEKNFKWFVENELNQDDFIFSTNCNSTMRSVRYKNQWKLIIRENPTSKEMYDLVKDPLEKNNIISNPPDIIGILEEKLILHSFKDILAGERSPGTCPTLP